MSIKDTIGHVQESLHNIQESLQEANAKAKAKLAICKQCDKFNDTTKFCGICHCFMPAKTRIPGMHCPIEKW